MKKNENQFGFNHNSIESSTDLMESDLPSTNQNRNQSTNQNHKKSRSTGKVILVGAGPGDPELITEKGKRVLAECDVVIYDRLASPKLIDGCRKDCERIYVGKRIGSHTLVQEEINQILIDFAKAGKYVVRLKGGDPFVFGRGGEEIIALMKEDITFEVVPGVTSAIAAAAYAGIPITHRGCSQSFHVITGHTKDGEDTLTDNYEILAKLEGTLVFLMGLNHIEQITEKLLLFGKSPETKAAVISNGTLPEQKTVRGTLANISNLVKEQKIPSPAILLFGEVAGLSLVDCEVRHLSGAAVGITGTKAFTKKLAYALQEEGANVSVYDFLEIKETLAAKQWEAMEGEIKKSNWIVFTSTNAIHYFFEGIKRNKIDVRSLLHAKFAVVGEGTKDALFGYGILADYMPEIYTTKALGEGLCKILIEKETVFLPRAAQASHDLTEIFERNSVSYKEVVIYDTIVIEEIRTLAWEAAEKLDYLTFASASGVHAFFKEYNKSAKELFQQCKPVCIGEVTRETMRSYGVENSIMAADYTAKGIVAAITIDWETA